jgi:NAD(P)-dependent dehydrogenase (short-subunit alcohol dehydrogenase family)
MKAIPSKTPTNLLREDAFYVIIGGTGGLGRSVTRWMVEKGARNIILVSRSGTAGGKVGVLIQELRGVGANIDVRRCDVANRSNVENLVQQVL